MLEFSGLSPAEGSKNNALDTLIEFSILDSDGDGIGIGSLIVQVNGFRAIHNGVFQDGWNGSFSEILPDGDNYNISIHPEDNFAVDQTVYIKLQVKDQDGKYANSSYAFKTISSYPFLSDSDPVQGITLSSSQVLMIEFKDLVDGINSSSLRVDLSGDEVLRSGVFQEGYQGDSSRIENITDGIRVYIDSEEALQDGSYFIEYRVTDNSDNPISGKIEFFVDLPEVVLPEQFAQTGFLGYYQGIKKVSNLGRGTAVTAEWGTPVSKSYQHDVFVIVYENEKRLNIFSDGPKYIADPGILAATIDGLQPGVTLSYAARAVSMFKGMLDTAGMEEVDTGFYRIPDPVTLTQSAFETDTKIYVSSVAGFPAKGFVKINNEIIYYNALSTTDNSLLIPTGGRGAHNTTPAVHISGDEAEIHLDCTDDNTVIVMSTPEYLDGYQSGRTVDNVGVLVTDYSDNDSKFFQGFDFCGYHSPVPWKVLNGQDDCGSYLGGEFNNQRGMNLFDRLLSREEVLLENVGEPVILIKRKWAGESCSCMTSRRQHPKIRSCSECYGTGYLGGYDQYFNLRRADQKIMMSFPDTTEDLPLGDNKHMHQDYKPTTWTIAIPAIRDRDLILRFDFTQDREFLYEVQRVTREKLIFGHYTRQRVELMRLDKTDVQYTFPITL